MNEDSPTQCPVIIGDLQMKDTQEVFQLIKDRVFTEDSWRIGVQNLREPRAVCAVALGTVLVYLITNSILGSIVLSMCLVPTIHLLIIRPYTVHHVIQNSPDLSPDTMYDFWRSKTDGSKMVVAKIGQQVVGTGVAMKQSETIAEIKRVAVTSQCAERGIGKQIMEALMEHCKQAGFSEVLLLVTNTNVAAIKFYRKLGFVHTSNEEQTELFKLNWTYLVMKYSLVDMKNSK